MYENLILTKIQNKFSTTTFLFNYIQHRVQKSFKYHQ